MDVHLWLWHFDSFGPKLDVFWKSGEKSQEVPLLMSNRIWQTVCGTFGYCRLWLSEELYSGFSIPHKIQTTLILSFINKIQHSWVWDNIFIKHYISTDVFFLSRSFGRLKTEVSFCKSYFKSHTHTSREIRKLSVSLRKLKGRKPTRSTSMRLKQLPHRRTMTLYRVRQFTKEAYIHISIG